MLNFLKFLCKTLVLYRLLLIFFSLCILYLILPRTRISTPLPIPDLPPPDTSLRHLVFGIASSSKSWPTRNQYVRFWWKPQYMRGYVFLDRTPSGSDTYNSSDTLPPVLISEDTSRFPYTYKGGLRSAIRVSRIVSETVNRNLSDVRWFVFGDDDTVFFPENLVKALSKYDHDRWFYVGSNSESFEQNSKYSFDMAFGGGGFAISHSLARVLAKVLDSCLMRYSYLYGSDSRIYSCLAELGVGLTHESGFHQVDIRGDLFGMLSAHPLAPLLSLHHLDTVQPVFPNMNRTQSLEHFFEAVNVDPARILQQTVCYDHTNSLTISVSWGYAVQVFEGNRFLPDLLSWQRTFTPWKRSMNVNSNVFIGNCLQKSALQNLAEIRVFSQKLELDIGQMVGVSVSKKLTSANAVDCGIHGEFNVTALNKEARELPSKTLTSSGLINILLLSSSICIIYFLVSVSLVNNSTPVQRSSSSLYVAAPPTSLDHLVFGIASNSNSWPNRKQNVRLWWKPQYMKGCVFLESMPPGLDLSNDTGILPPVCISEDTSKFRYTYRGGLRSAIRVARVVLETVALNYSDTRWFVFGDDDTVFFPENLAKTLSKYDHNQWYYIGTNSESFEQNVEFSFQMAFGGGGFAISYALGRVLAKVLDSCLERYPHLYGSDSRIFSCVAELGVGLTHEPGFHQVDIRGDLFGLLTAHPLTPLVSLHHLDYVEPIFPNMTTNQALEHLFEAVKADPGRILQQTICYDPWYSWTISVAWGHSVQVFEGNRFLPDVLPPQETFRTWKGRRTPLSSLFSFNTREFPWDPCRRPTILFLDRISSTRDGIKSSYRRNVSDDCLQNMGSPKKLEEIRVFSQKLELDIGQLHAPRRHCCDVLPSSSSIGKVMEIAIRECKEEELIFMHA
ncbi:hypothetical protein HHK36_005568 [Tetracentron sinense]|uniref:Uncharacterized protein n=1 Tax=Tetracentron sinense TaxID=13715 RepID=A0A834ZVM4_TETSI|nr:hypothetical protein HHK36_005568 [Tetracentron sinense]